MAARCPDPAAAKQYIQEQGAPIVIKVDRLAARKGVIVAMTLDEAYEAVDSMLVKGAFGSAGSQVIVEEFLEGEEASLFALVDGENDIPLESAQDHKRVGDGDTGLNTEEGCRFAGVLYAGFMIEKKSGLPKLIEYNVRFGDLECQVSHRYLTHGKAYILGIVIAHQLTI
ncbi:Phosphoribosylamine--glycine ligase [Vitis vinifera]|uniref:Phosphoribosylamine--glycine ligase n=1 Tax=Vitis vinifera TaxID=29760 RepID=A0A438CJH6_VITVI|nr:Phosphoribosylamine--glycine ligase [Vitis vinifera]